jgi:hypothetical protein
MTEKKSKQQVGYKNPPVSSRFAKGKSGNPKGRPRKVHKSDDAALAPLFTEGLRKELTAMIEVNDGGRRVAMSKLAAVIRSLFNSAFKGNAAAQRAVLENARRLEVHDAAIGQAQALERREAFSDAVKYKANRTRIWQDALAKGEEPSEPWPHPDDILLDPSGDHWRIRGPVFAECMPRYHYYRARRDWLFFHSLLDFRSRNGCSRYLMQWLEFDRLLPKRWQIEFQHEVMVEVLCRIPIAELRHYAALAENHMLEARADADIRPASADEIQQVRQMWRKVKSAKMQNALRQALEDFELVLPVANQEPKSVR